MSNPSACVTHNAVPVKWGDIPVLDMSVFREAILQEADIGNRMAALFGIPSKEGDIRLLAVMANGGSSALTLYSTPVKDRYPALTPECPQAHEFEREVFEQWGVTPEGHPWLKPVRAPFSASPASPFFAVEGVEVHEVAVGPVHAGIIEPGHFRFQCHGEQVFHLEISLGYQHRGIEWRLVGGPDRRTMHYMETAAGDTTVGHASAYCQAVEALSGCNVSARAQVLRAVALELERLANHTGDLGAMAGDIGFLPTSSFCGRIRGDFLNMTALLCGSRFGRNLVRPGGVGFEVEPERLEKLGALLDRALKDVTIACNLLWNTTTVRARFENTGTLKSQDCLALGLVGVAARASGVERDVRQEFPGGAYRFFQLPVSTFNSGNVFGRAYVRWMEIQRSIAFIKDMIRTMPGGEIRQPMAELAAGSLVVSMVEGWRGEICHVATTDDAGRFKHYKVIDPSFHNWMGLAYAMRDQQISDFPLCNKSFNLSYCGHDL
jgi:Ni,Fe-hydrogenase III large subunit